MHDITTLIHQSPPIDTTQPFSADKIAGKTILITGGASGIGAAFARHWASHGARLIIGDIDVVAGETLVAELRQTTGSGYHHFLKLDVTDWDSQAEFFRSAARLSAHGGGIHAVVANAGILDRDHTFDDPPDGDVDLGPPKPDLKCLDVNITGVMYTTHLALYWLARNGASSKVKVRNANESFASQELDRRLLLIGSVASLMPFSEPQYTTSKHAVLGLFRSLRGTVWRHGIRVNLLCSYLIKTPLITPPGKLMLAGGGLGKVSDVVDAGTRLMAERGIAGRALVVGPRVRVKEWIRKEESTGGEDEEDGQKWEVLEVLSEDDPKGDETGRDGVTMSSWECHAHDYERVELFVWRFTRLLVQVERIRGWAGWARDILGVFGRLIPSVGGKDR